MDENKRKEFIKLIQDNPKLPIEFIAHNADFCDDYGSTIFERAYFYIATVWVDEDEYGNTYYDDKDEIVEIFADRLCDDEKYENLTDEEFKRAITDYVEDNVEHYDAIVVRLYH